LPFAKQKLSGEDQNSDIQSKMFANHVASHGISVKLPTSASSVHTQEPYARSGDQCIF